MRLHSPDLASCLKAVLGAKDLQVVMHPLDEKLITLNVRWEIEYGPAAHVSENRFRDEIVEFADSFEAIANHLASPEIYRLRSQLENAKKELEKTTNDLMVEIEDLKRYKINYELSKKL